MPKTNSKRYLFQADATGVAGQFVFPFPEAIPIQAASALPSEGGRGSSRVDGFRHKDILSFGSAYTEVGGAEMEDGVLRRWHCRWWRISTCLALLRAIA